MKIKNKEAADLKLSLIASTTLLAFLLLQGCKFIDAPPPARTQLDSALVVPTSDLNVPVFYPIRELETMLNEKLTSKVIEAAIVINQKGDSLFLTISRFANISIRYDGASSMTFQLPLEVTGVVHSKILGIEMKNKTPIHTKLNVTLKSQLAIGDNWELISKTKIVTLRWIENPSIKIAGIKFSLKSTVEKMIFKKSDLITEKIDMAISDVVHLEKSVDKIWTGLQRPIRISKKYRPVWIKTHPAEMTEKLVGLSKDTLTIMVGLKAYLRTVLDSVAHAGTTVPLGKHERRLEANRGMDVFLFSAFPFKDINRIITNVLDTVQLSFQGHKVRIKECEMFGTTDGLAIRVDLRGDLRARLYLTGSIGYDSASRSIEITNFGFDVQSEESLVRAADWFAHEELIEKIRPYLKLPVGATIDAVPMAIFNGIEQGRLGNKIDVHFTDFNASLYNHLITRDNIQLIIRISGKANIELQKAIFTKKQKI